ncbi:MAG TPA: hypothetical protein PLO61_03875 [Fimbriimonadaceae bacterium]|nr:hypothetical protein [Fimbriimonadaceae bacterium]
MKLRSLYALALVAGACLAGATTTVAPTDFETTSTTGTFLGPMATSVRKLQLMIAPTELVAHLGRQINAISFRIPPAATANWPVADATSSTFEIRLSACVEIPLRTTTFASNVVGAQTLCRSGSLTYPANSFTFGGNPNAFGPDITFSTPYPYNGGPLMIEISMSGFTPGNSRSVEAVLATGGPPGVYGTKVTGIWASSLTATTGSQANFSVTQIKSVSNVPTVTGTVDFGQLTAAYNSGANLPSSIPVLFRDATNAEIANGTATYNPVTGALSVAVPAAVTVPYRVSFKHGFWLRKTMPNPSDPATPVGSYAFGTVTPLVGDSDDDNEVTNFDYSLWAAANGNSVTANTDNDFDGDGEITNFDYSLWAANNGALGDN